MSDYDELAKRLGGVPADDAPDYDALARKLGGVPAGLTPEEATRLRTFQTNQIKNNPLNQIGNVMRGSVDTIGGLAQLLSRGASAVGLVPESTGNSFLAGPKEVEAQNKQARANIDQWFGPDESAINPVRAISSTLAALPLAPTKYIGAPTALQRTLGAAAAGGVVGGSQEVPEPKNAFDFWKNKASQIGVGTIGGAVAQPLSELAVKGVVGALSGAGEKASIIARNLSGADGIESLVKVTRDSLARSGMDYDALSEAAKQSILGDVQKALSSYGGVEPGAVARKAAFQESGFDPLRHWITRNPAEFTLNENLPGTGPGAAIGQRRADLDSFVSDALNRLRGNQVPPTGAGAPAVKDLADYVTGQKGKTSVLYNTFQDIAPNVKGDPQRFANDVFGGLEGKMALGSLPDGLKKVVNGISSGEIPLTPSTLYQLQKMLKPGADGSVNYALGHLSRAIDREMGQISQSVGPTGSALPVTAGTALPNQQGQYAADVLQMARKQHASTMGDLESTPLLAKASEGTLPPEEFVGNLMRAPTADVAKVWMTLGPEAKDGIRGQVIDNLKRVAFGGASDEGGKSAAQASFNRVITDPVQREKLNVILGPQMFEEVKRLGLMLESAHMLPSGSKVNTSNTMPALATYGTSLGDALAAKGLWGGKAVQNTMQNAAAEIAQTADPNALGRRSLLIDPRIEELLRRGGGYAGGLLGSGSLTQGAGSLFRQPPN